MPGTWDFCYTQGCALHTGTPQHTRYEYSRTCSGVLIVVIGRSCPFQCVESNPYPGSVGCLRRFWLGWVSCSLFPIKINPPTHPNATFNLFFLGLGRPWVGEFVGFTIIFPSFPALNTKKNGESQTPQYFRTEWIENISHFGKLFGRVMVSKK